MIYTITLNAALDKSMQVLDFSVGSLHRAESVYVEAGGKGINVAKAIRSLGHACVAMGFLGGASGGIIERRLVSLGIECDFVKVSGETRTNIKIIDPDRQTVTEVNEPGQPVSPGQADALKNKLLKRVAPGDTVIFSGSVPPGVDSGIYAQWINMLRGLGVETILDADGELFRQGIEARPTAVKPNLAEMIHFCNKPLQPDGDIRPEAEVLLRKGIETVILSLGQNGALLFQRDKALSALALDVAVKSTVGAGDAMVAAWAVARALSLQPEDALRMAVASAGATVNSGTAGIFSKRTVDELMTEVRISPYCGG